ncbi:ABC-type transport auxiliary lipoprotein family protein [Spirochaeta dissipatitropha]
MMNTKIASVLIVILLLAACQTTEQAPTFYYTLDYLDYTEQSDLRRQEALPYRVWIQTAEIPRTYSGRQIVIRHFGPRITYSENDLWAGRLADYFPRLIISRLQAYNSFRNVSMDFLDTRPDYEVAISVNRAELVQSEALSEASLEMTLALRDGSSGQTVLSHSANRMKPLYAASMELYVQTLNEIVLEEIDAFIEKVYMHLSGTPDEVSADDSSRLETIPDEPVETREGHGILLMPSISGIRGTSSYQAIASDGSAYSGVFGQDLALPAGQYQVRYGTGPDELRMTMQGIQIRRGYRTLIDPEWGEVSVEIIDERRNSRDVIYEIFDSSGTSYITQFPAREDLGDTTNVLQLPPGLYKITIDNEPFNTYRNFTTLKIEKGEYKRLTIVVDAAEGPVRMIGAGILSDDEHLLSVGNWSLNSSIHATLNLSANHGSAPAEADYSGTLTGQLDNQLRFIQNRLSFTVDHFSELGLGYGRDEGLIISQDDFDLKIAAIFDVYRDIGLYAGFDVNSHLFDRFDYSPPEGFDDPVKLAPPFFPLRLREGAGLNIRMLNHPRASMTLRSGFGLRQEFNTDVIQRSNDNNDYIELENTSSAGLELSAMGNFRPLRRVQLNTSTYVLFPLLEGDQIILESSAEFNWTLLQSISLNYRFQLRNRPGEEDFVLDYDHRMVLRLTYLLN